MCEKQCECCFDSQICYINYLNDERSNIKLYICDYIENKEYYNEQIKNIIIQLKCEYGNRLKYVSCLNKKDYFCHVNSQGILSDMSKWHMDWQNNFSEHKEIQIGKRRADVAIHNHVIEFQHSAINKKTVDIRKTYYDCENYILNWVLDGTNNNIVVLKNTEDTIEIEFKHLWMYESFLSYTKIYIDYNNNLYSYDPNSVKMKMVTCLFFMTNTEYINSIKNNTLSYDSNIFAYQCNLYVNQRGAGCGKTYESVQLLNKEEFEHKDIFIYVTKQHSAKSVIYDELMEQINDKKITLDEDPDVLTNQSDKKQHIQIKQNNVVRKIIIGTIDALIWAFNEEIKKKAHGVDFTKGMSCNMFINMLINMINYDDGDIIDINITKVMYQEHILLNKRTMIIIDEAQDLGEEYIEAFTPLHI